MMLRKVEFENFMSLKDVSVVLEPLTVFIGPNASGKSAIFKALVTFSKMMNRAPVRGPHGEFALESGVPSMISFGAETQASRYDSAPGLMMRRGKRITASN